MMGTMAKNDRERDPRGSGRDGNRDGEQSGGEPVAGVASVPAAPGALSASASSPSSAGSAEARGAPLEGRETLRILRDDPGNAVERLRARIRSGEADWRTWHNLAIALDRIGDKRHAIDAAENALSRHSDSPDTWFLLGLLLRRAERFDEAIAALDRVAALAPEFPRLLATRGVCHFHRGDHDAARRDLALALARTPEDATSLFNLAIVHVAAKEYLRAQECIERLIAIEPERAGHYYRFLVELGEVRALDETLTQAHRIKNLLSVSGDRLRRFYAEWGERIDPEGRDDLRGIRDDLGAIYGDMVGLLGAIRPRPMRFEPARLRRIVDRIGFVAMTRSRGIPIECDVPEDLPDLVCDIEMVQEALLNLLLNAIEAVVDRFHEQAAECGRVRIHARQVPERIEILVADNGAGIPAGDLARIFRLGFTTKRLGSGIGLAHTQRIVEEHGGRVSIHGTGPEGSTLRIDLPLVPRPSERLVQLQHRARLLADPRELVLEEPGEDLGL